MFDILQLSMSYLIILNFCVKILFQKFMSIFFLLSKAVLQVKGSSDKHSLNRGQPKQNLVLLHKISLIKQFFIKLTSQI